MLYEIGPEASTGEDRVCLFPLAVVRDDFHLSIDVPPTY